MRWLKRRVCIKVVKNVNALSKEQIFKIQDGIKRNEENEEKMLAQFSSTLNNVIIKIDESG